MYAATMRRNGGASLHAVDPQHLTPVLGDKGALGLFTGSAIFFWTWDGFMRVAIMTSEVKKPRTTIPIAIGGGVAIAAVMFVGVGAITLGVLGADELARQDTPLLAAAQKAMGPRGAWIILAAALLAALAEVLRDLLSASRVILAMAKAHELPATLSKIHQRAHSPRHAVLALGLLSAAADLCFDLRPLIEVAGSFMLAWYFITHYAALQLPVNKRLTSPVFSWCGVIGCVGLTISMPAPATLAAAATLAVLTVSRWLFRHPGRRARSRA